MTLPNAPARKSFQRRLNDHFVYRALRRAQRDVAPGGRVLLAPCGDGWYFESFAADHTRVVAVDIVPGKIERARQRLGPGLSLLQGSILELPFDDDRFDLVISSRFVLHFNDIIRAQA